PCLIASDMPNANNANAQLFHRSQCSQPRKLSRVNARKSSTRSDRFPVATLGTDDCPSRRSLNRRSAASLLFCAIREKPFVSLCDAFAQRDTWFPPHPPN